MAFFINSKKYVKKIKKNKKTILLVSKKLSQEKV